MDRMSILNLGIPPKTPAEMHTRDFFMSFVRYISKHFPALLPRIPLDVSPHVLPEIQLEIYPEIQPRICP